MKIFWNELASCRRLGSCYLRFWSPVSSSFAGTKLLRLLGLLLTFHILSSSSFADGKEALPKAGELYSSYFGATPSQPTKLVPDEGEQATRGTGVEEILEYEPHHVSRHWYFNSRVLALRWTDSDSHVLLEDSANSTILDGSQLEFSSRIGVELDLGFVTNDNRGVQLRYFVLEEQTSDFQYTGDLNFLGPGFSFAVNPGHFAMQNQHLFHGAQLRFFRSPGCCGDARVARHGSVDNRFWSVRWIGSFDEFFAVELNTPASVVASDVKNNIIGWTFGEQRVICSLEEGLGIHVSAEAGLIANITDGDVTSGIVLPPVAASETQLGFMGDVEVNLVCQINDRLTLNAGYRFLGISNIATAAGQVSSWDLTAPSTSFRRQDMILHGAQLGIEFHR